MSKKDDFEAKFKAFAKELLQEIDERNEELLEGMRDIAQESFGHSFLESDEPPSPAAPILESVNIAPRIGFSNKAIELFQHVEDDTRRHELMAQFSHMEHARTRKEWVVWAGHVQLLLEGLSAEYLFRADNWLNAPGEVSLLARVLSIIDGRQIRQELDKDKRYEDKVQGIRSYKEFQSQIEDGVIGIDDKTGVAMALEGNKFFYAKSARWSAGRLVIQAEMKEGKQRTFNIDVKNCPSAIPQLNIIGLFVPISLLKDPKREDFRLEDLRFMLSPIPIGSPGGRDKYGRNRRKIWIGPKVSIRFSEQVHGFGFGVYWSRSNIYELSIKEIVIKPNDTRIYVNLLPREKEATSWKLSDFKIKERFVLLEMVVNASMGRGAKGLAQFEFDQWWDSLKSEQVSAWDELSGMRNRFFHGGDTKLSFPQQPSAIVIKISEIIHHMAQTLFRKA